MLVPTLAFAVLLLLRLLLYLRVASSVMYDVLHCIWTQTAYQHKIVAWQSAA